MWTFIKLNYYGGEIYKHSDGRVASQIFNYYYHPIGFEVKNPDGSYSRVKTLDR